MKSGLGQAKDGDLFPIPVDSLRDDLNYLTADHFRPFVGGEFRAVAEDGTLANLRLVDVRDLRRRSRVKSRGEAYSLMFDGNPSDLAPGRFDFDHSSLGRFNLSINPVNLGNLNCEAVINRVAAGVR